MKIKTLYKVVLNSKIHKRSQTVRRYVENELLNDMPYQLKIIENPSVSGEFYLIPYDENDEDLLSDTLHDSIEEAMNQAEIEFGVLREHWVKS